jgi:hypothetical protein
VTKRPTLTTSAGAPIGDNQNTITAGPYGPALLQDYQRGEGFRPASLMPVLRPRARGPRAGQCRSGDPQHIVAGGHRLRVRNSPVSFYERSRASCQLLWDGRTEHYEVQPVFDTNVSLHPYTSGIGPWPGPGTWMPLSKDPSHYNR